MNHNDQMLRRSGWPRNPGHAIEFGALAEIAAQHVLSLFLNSHRPCLFPTHTLDAKGRVKSRYRDDVMILYDKLKSLATTASGRAPGRSSPAAAPSTSRRSRFAWATSPKMYPSPQGNGNSWVSDLTAKPREPMPWVGSRGRATAPLQGGFGTSSRHPHAASVGCHQQSLPVTRSGRSSEGDTE